MRGSCGGGNNRLRAPRPRPERHCAAISHPGSAEMYWQLVGPSAVIFPASFSLLLGLLTIACCGAFFGVRLGRRCTVIVPRTEGLDALMQLS